MSSTTRYSNGKTSQTETNDAKASRLRREVASLEARRDQILEELEEKYTELDSLLPPFEVGDIAKNYAGARVQIHRIDRAFDSWVCEVMFVDKPKSVDRDRIHIYAAEDLELVK